MKPDFIQDFPPPPNLYDADAALKAELARRLPPDVLKDAVTPVLKTLGKATAETLPALEVAAEAEPPVHVPYDAWGRRVDVIRTSRAWDELKAFSARHGLVATGYDATLGEHRRVAQAAMLHIFSASSATFACPLAMTDAAARVLLDLGNPSLSGRLVPRLTSRNPETFITSGQWMTERTGGSDVSDTSTVARSTGSTDEGDKVTLHGVKWFTSATTSEMALALARHSDAAGAMTEGSRGLTLYCVDVERAPGGGYRGITVHRLKDKLGTKALPTAELTLDGVSATRVGPLGRGVPSISGMLNITRFYNAISAASGMHKATALAHAYANHRMAFGRPLSQHPLHMETLGWLTAQTAGALAMSLEVAWLLGRLEQDVATDEERRRLRGLIPLTKLTTGKQAVAVASEALECFGGAGYVEDTGLPRLLRDAQVLSIWEGTTNVLSLDLLRAEAKEGGFSAVLADLHKRTEVLGTGLPAAAVATLRTVVAQLGKNLAAAATQGPAVVEANARRLALATGHAVQSLLLAETAMATATPDASARFATFTTSTLGGPLG